MRSKKIFIITVTIMAILCSCNKDNTDKGKTVAKKVDNKKEIEVIDINHIATSATEYDIDDVTFEKASLDNLKDEVGIYSVTPREYTEEEIQNILKTCFNDDIKEKDISEDLIYYDLEGGGDIYNYTQSGTLSYSSSKDGNYESSANELEESILIEKAEEFINKSGLFELKDLELLFARPALYVEDKDSKEIERYEVLYSKNPPKGIDGFSGTGLGLSIELDINGNVIGFICNDRIIEKTNDIYPTKEESEITKDIIDNYNAMIDTNTDISEVNISSIEYTLYCDSVYTEQKIMVPHYKLKDVDQQVSIVMPAIKDEYLNIK